MICRRRECHQRAGQRWIAAAAGAALSAWLAGAACAALPAEVDVAAAAQSESPQLSRISNVFVDTDLRQALQDIALQAGVTIIPGASVTGLVTADLQDVPLEQALEMVLAGTGYVVDRYPGFYLVYSPDPKDPAFLQLSQTRRVDLNYINAKTILELLAPQFKEFVRGDDDTGTLLVTAPGPLMERVLADIHALDQPRKHIMLDARVVVLERNDLLQLGVEWNFPRIQAGAFTDSDRRGGGIPGPDWPWAIHIGYTPSKEFTNALLLTLNLLAQNGEATIVSSPQLMAEDAREAGMSVTTEEYFQIVSEGVLTQVDLETIESGTTLKITPRVGDQDQITLEMAIEVSDVVSRGQDNLPVVTRRKANTTVRVRDGGTAVIAGLMDSRTELIERNVPGAADMPMLGRLFQNDAATNESKQLAVFITATLVDEAELTAESQRDKPRIAPVDEEAFRRSLREALERLREDLP